MMRFTNIRNFMPALMILALSGGAMAQFHNGNFSLPFDDASQGESGKWKTTGDAFRENIDTSDPFARMFAASTLQQGPRWCDDDNRNSDYVCRIFFKYRSNSDLVGMVQVTSGTDTFDGPALEKDKSNWTLVQFNAGRCNLLKTIKFSVGGGLLDVDSVSSLCVPVPEPATMLALLGPAGWIMLRRRRR